MEYYTLGDCILILTGNVQSKDFFAALDEVEALVLQRKTTTEAEAQDGRRVGRPWIDSAIPPMVADGRVGVFPPYGAEAAAPAPMSVAFPSDDESRGTISIAWRGPPYVARATWAHLSLLWDYLSDSPTSPLQLAFVENESPLCADIGPASDVSMQGYYQLWFQEVDVEAMEECVPLFFDIISI
jgi:Zn-dependent M16 (insulinase) family peptidase